MEKYQRKKYQQTGSPCSHLPSFFRENFRHCPSSLERNWKKWNAGQVVPWTTRCRFRRPKSIKDTLVRAAVSRSSSTVGQCKPCGDKRCKCCLQLQHTQVFHSKTTGKEYKIFCNVNCKTPNVVYLLDCHVCGSQYVGESVQPFNIYVFTLTPINDSTPAMPSSPIHWYEIRLRSK